MERIDCHTHSAYSGHGQGTLSDMVEKALDSGLATLAATEHLVLPQGMDPLFETSMSEDEMRGYIRELTRLRQQLQERGMEMDLVIGIEADWLEGRTEELEALCEPFEYVLGSVHFIGDRPIDDSRDLSLWDDLGVDGVWRAYLDAWMDMATHPGPIMAYSHLDLPKKYGWLPSFDVTRAYHEMAEVVADSGRMIEVNTAGLRKDVHEAYPSLDVLKIFCEAGVECTVGSDAHSPADVAAGYDEAVRLMQLAGYRYVTVPTSDGDRRHIKIDCLD